MANKGPQTQYQSSLSVSISLQSIYKCLCPNCRSAVVDLFSDQIDKGVLRKLLEGQLEAKSDGS